MIGCAEFICKVKGAHLKLSASLSLKLEISLDNGRHWIGQNDKTAIHEASDLLYRITLTNIGDVKFNLVWVYVNNVGTFNISDFQAGKKSKRIARGSWCRGRSYYAIVSGEYDPNVFYEAVTATGWYGE